MENDFKQIQLGIDSIIGTKTIIRRKKKTETDKKRELFFNMMNNLDELNVRQNIMYADLNLDFADYDDRNPYKNVIGFIVPLNSVAMLLIKAMKGGA